MAAAPEMTSEDKAEFLDRLAKAARHRFDSRRRFEWQICFGIWTVFLVGAAAVINASPWKPGLPEVGGAALWATILVLAFSLWAIDRHKNDLIDIRTSYHWEKELMTLLQKTLPTSLAPTGLEDETKQSRTDYYQAFFTFAFGLLFVFCVWSKQYRSSSPSPSASVEFGGWMNFWMSILAGLISGGVVSAVFYLLSLRGQRRDMANLRNLHRITIQALENAGYIAVNRDSQGQPTGIKFLLNAGTARYSEKGSPSEMG